MGGGGGGGRWAPPPPPQLASPSPLVSAGMSVTV